MADYRGLTIKIGGDTGSLQSALRAASKAASATQTKLRAVEKALNLDPSSVSGISTKLKLMENRAESLTAQVRALNTQYKSLGRETSASDPSKTIAQLASETKNAGLNAELAQQRYNRLNAELAGLYRSTEQVASESKAFMASWKSITGSGKFKMSEMFDLDPDQFDRAASALRKVDDRMDAVIDRAQRLRSAWNSANDELSDAKAVSALERMKVQSEGLSAELKSLDASMAKLNVPSAVFQSFAETEAEAKRLGAVLDGLESSMKQTERAMKLDPSSIDAARAHMRNLAEASKVASQRAELLSKEIKALESDTKVFQKAQSNRLAQDMSETSAKVERLSSELNQASSKVEQLTSDMRSLKQVGKLDDSGMAEYKAEIAAASAEVDKLSSALREARANQSTLADASKLNSLKQDYASATAAANGYAAAMKDTGVRSGVTLSNIKTIGMTLSATLTPAMSLAAGAAVSAAGDIDSAYRDMRKTVSGTEEDFERLKQSAVDFSMTNFTSADQMLGIQAIGGELGVVTSALDTFAQTVSNLDIATDLNAEDAATALGQLSNIMSDLDESTMPNFGDALVRLGNNGASTESQISDIAKRIGSMGSIIGMSTPDILAWSSTIASTGQNAEAAGTAISKTMSDIETAVSAGGAGLQQFAEVSGMSAQQFADTWNNNPTQAIKSFIEGLKRIEESGGSADATLGELGITSVRQKQAIMGLMQTIGGLNDNLEMSNNAWNGVSDAWGDAGDAAREAQAKSEGFSGSVQRLKNIAQTTASSLGDSVAPAISKIADAAADAAKWFDGLSDSQKQTVVKFGAMAAAVGPAMSMFSSAGEAIKNLNKRAAESKAALAKIASGADEACGSVRLFTAGTKAANIANYALATGLNLLKAALGGIVVVAAMSFIMELVAEFQEAQQHAKLLADSTRDAAEIMGSSKADAESLSDSVDKLSQSAEDAMEGMRSLGDETADAFSDVKTDSRMLDGYVATIRELANQSGLTAIQQNMLKQAVEGYNSITGEQYSVVDAVNGKIADQSGVIQENTDQLAANAEAWKQRATQQAYSEAASKYLKKQVELEQDLYEAKRKQKEAAAAFQEANDTGDWVNASRLKADLDEANQALSDLTANYEAAKANSDAFAKSAVIAGTEAAKALEQAGHTVTDFTMALADAGVDQQLFSQLGEEGIKQLATAYDGSSESIVNALTEMGQGTALSTSQIRSELTLMGEEVRQAFSNNGLSLDEFAQKCAEAGITSKQLAQYTAEDFGAMAAAANGDIGSIVQAIQTYNTSSILDKNGSIRVDGLTILTDAEGKIYTYNGAELMDKSGVVDVDVTGLTDAKGNEVEWNNGKLESKSATAAVDSSGVDRGTESVENFMNQEFEDRKKTASVEYSSVDKGRTAIKNFMNERFTDRTVTLTINTNKNETVTRSVVTQPSGGGSIPRIAAAASAIAPRGLSMSATVRAATPASAVSVPDYRKRVRAEDALSAMAADLIVSEVAGRVASPARKGVPADLSALSAAQDETNRLIDRLIQVLGPTIRDNAPVTVVSERDERRRILGLIS